MTIRVFLRLTVCAAVDYLGSGLLLLSHTELMAGLCLSCVTPVPSVCGARTWPMAYRAKPTHGCVIWYADGAARFYWVRPVPMDNAEKAQSHS
ncbi:hypothetical protein B0J13DRAFT_545090, partial [Dactylonectria estremocensis]